MKVYFLLFFSTVLFYSCSDQHIEDQVAFTNTFLKPRLNTVLLGNQSKEVENTLVQIRHLAKKNDYLLLQYYNIQLNRSASLKQFTESIQYIDSLDFLYNTTNSYFQKQAEILYINAISLKASILFSQNKFLKAYELYYKVMDWHETHQNNFAANFFFHSMGMNAYQQKLYEKSIEYFKKQLQIIHTTPETDTLFNDQFKYYYKQQSLNNIGLCYTKMNLLDSAQAYYNQAINYIVLAKNHGIRNFILKKDDFNACYAVVLGNLAKIYGKRGDLDKAIETYKKSIHYTLFEPVEMNNFQRDTIDAGLSIIQLSQIYLQKKDTLNFKKTVEDLNKIIPQNLKGHGFITNSDYVLGSMKANATYFSMINDKDKANTYLNQYIAYSDSLEIEQKESKQKNVSEAIEIKTKEDEVNKLKINNKFNFIYLVGAIIITILISITAIIFYKSNQKEKRNNALLKQLNSELNQQEQETAFAYEQALEANKEKDEILQIVAHDLRNPLTGIATLADLMLEVTDNFEQVEYLNSISNTSKRATQLVNNLVNKQNHKSETISLEKLSLTAIIKQIIPLFTFKLSEKKITLHTDLPTEEMYAMAHWGRLERIIGNLLQNAVKFTHHHGEIHIKLYAIESKAYIQIQDNGIGMSADMLKALENNENVTVRKGTDGEKSYGLGIHICKQIVKSLKGNLRIQSTENKGTITTIELMNTTIS